MSNVKPGDFAVVVSVETPTLARNIGVHVLVVDKFDGPVTNPGNAPFWTCEILQTCKTIIDGKIQTRYPGALLYCADKYLRRIDPPKGDQEEETKAPKDEEIRVG